MASTEAACKAKESEIGYEFWYPSPMVSKMFFWVPKLVHWMVVLLPVAILAAVYVPFGPLPTAICIVASILHMYFNVLTKTALSPRVTTVKKIKPGEMKKKRVAVIGAGPCGLTATKELFLKGHDVSCYDRQEAVGGVFAHKFWHAGQLTSSPYVTSYSDFEPERFDGKQRYRHWFKEEYCFYLENYVRKFGFGSCMKLGYEILEINQVTEPGMEKPVFYFRVKVEGVIRKEGPFDHIAIASGSFDGEPNIPKTPGLEAFPGKVFHSTNFTDNETFKALGGKRVLTVGLGESMADLLGAIMDLPKPPSACAASVRNGAFTIPRINPLNNRVNDFDSTRLRYALPKFLHNAAFVVCSYLTALFRWEPCAKNRVRFNMFRQIPHYAPAYRPASKSGAWLHLAADGRLKMKPGVDRIEGSTVYFTDGSKMEDVDAIVYGSGFKPRHFPFFNDNSFPEGLDFPKGTPIDRLFRIFDPNHGDSIGFIGIGIRPLIGTIPTIGEIQSRLFTMVVSGERELPCKMGMMKQIAKDEAKARNNIGKYYACGYKQVADWIPFMDSIAKEIGCIPPLYWMLTRPSLAIKLLIGPMTAFHYRLHGPDSNAEYAEDVIRTLPFGTRPVDATFFLAIHASVALLTWPLFIPRLILALLSPKFWYDKSVPASVRVGKISKVKEDSPVGLDMLDSFLSSSSFQPNMAKAMSKRLKVLMKETLSSGTAVRSLQELAEEAIFASNTETLFGENALPESFLSDFATFSKSQDEAAKARLIGALRTARDGKNGPPIFGEINGQLNKDGNNSTDEIAVLLLWRASTNLVPSAVWLAAKIMKDEKSLWTLKVERAKSGTDAQPRPLLSTAVTEGLSEEDAVLPDVSLNRNPNLYPVPTSFKPTERFGTKPVLGQHSSSFAEGLDQASFRKQFSIFNEEEKSDDKTVNKVEVNSTGENFYTSALKTFIDTLLLAPSDIGASIELKEKKAPLTADISTDIMVKIVKA